MKKGRKARSMRGATVDFDLMGIKQQMASQPKSMEVKAREDFIEQRLNRRAKRRAAQVVTPVIEVDVVSVDSPTQEKSIVEEATNLPVVEALQIPVIEPQLPDGEPPAPSAPKVRRIKKKIKEDE